MTDEIKDTLKKLGLSEYATLNEIRSEVKHHTDTCNGCDIALQEITEWLVSEWLGQDITIL
jgi:hypothetical protein